MHEAVMTVLVVCLSGSCQLSSNVAGCSTAQLLSVTLRRVASSLLNTRECVCVCARSPHYACPEVIRVSCRSAVLH